MTTSHKTFKKAAALMLVAILASRLLGLIREMLIAKQFGSTGAVSAYTAAFNLPDLLYFFLSSGALSNAFVPVLTERFEMGKEKEAWQIFSIIACVMGLVLTAGVAVFWIYAGPLARTLAVPGFVEQHPDLVPLTVLLTRIILPCQLFFFLGGVMSAALESRQNFKVRDASPVIYNLGIIFGAIVLSRWFHIAGLALGTLIGAFVGNIAYAYWCLRKQGFEFHPSLNIRHPGVIKVAKLALPVILGLGLPQIDVIVNRWFASFVSASAPAALNYANRLMQVPLGIFAQAAGTAILPMLSVYAARNAINDMRSGISYGLRAIMVENIPATLFMIVMADPIVRTVYMHGEFRPSDVPVTAIALIFYSAGIFAWAGQMIVARGFFAMHDTVTPVVIGTICTAIFLPLNYFLMHAMGVGGIALATTVAVTLHFVGLTWFLRRRLHGIEGGSILRAGGRIVLAALVMVVICYGVRLGMSRVVGSWQLQDGDVHNPAALATTLRAGRTPLSGYLYSKLSENTRGMLVNDESARAIQPSLSKLLLDDLNQILQGPSLYDKERFSRTHIPDDTLSRVAEHPTGQKLTELNRRLLEAAYPDEVEEYGRSESWLNRLIAGANKHKRQSADDPILLQEMDIQSIPDFAAKLADTDSAVSVYLVSRLPDSTRQALKTYVAKCKSAKDLPLSLMHDINISINTETIYDPARFAGISLPAKTLALTERHASGKQLSRENRLLIEAAYPREIVRRPVDRVESKMGSFLTVLLAMFLGGIAYFGLLRLMKVDELDYIWNAVRRRFSRRSGDSNSDSTPPADMGGSVE